MPKVMSNGSSNGSGRGRRRGPRVTTALSEINVVPLVDVMLVLLIIFRVAAPMMQQGLDVLGERVHQELRTRDKKEVFLRSDGQVTMQQMMEVLDRLKEGGVQNVGIMSRPVER